MSTDEVTIKNLTGKDKNKPSCFPDVLETSNKNGN